MKPSEARWRACLQAGALAGLFALSLASSAEAAPGAPSQCGPTSVGTGAVAVTFPASGATGPGVPQQYVTIGNPSASATLWVNAMPGGTAAANTAGSFQIGSGQALTWALPEYPPPATISIIASAGATPVTCAYQ
jgi:hypothetical protein